MKSRHQIIIYKIQDLSWYNATMSTKIKKILKTNTLKIIFNIIFYLYNIFLKILYF